MGKDEAVPDKKGKESFLKMIGDDDGQLSIDQSKNSIAGGEDCPKHSHGPAASATSESSA